MTHNANQQKAGDFKPAKGSFGAVPHAESARPPRRRDIRFSTSHVLGVSVPRKRAEAEAEMLSADGAAGQTHAAARWATVQRGREKRLLMNHLLHSNFPINTPLWREGNVKVGAQIRP